MRGTMRIDEALAQNAEDAFDGLVSAAVLGEARFDRFVLCLDKETQSGQRALGVMLAHAFA